MSSLFAAAAAAAAVSTCPSKRGFGAVFGLTLFYYTGFVEADELSYGENGLKWEGMLPSFAVFLLGWIVTFTAMEHDIKAA